MGWYQPQPFDIQEEMRKRSTASTLKAKALALRKQANQVKAEMDEAAKKYKAADQKALKAEAEAAKADQDAAAKKAETKPDVPSGDKGKE